jgi:hypothetical protein
MDTRNAAPISGAQVYLHAQYAHRLTPHDDHGESSPQTREREHDINIDQEVSESPTPGVYEISYRSFQPGDHTLMFHITAIGRRKLDPEITIEARRTIGASGNQYDHTMMESDHTMTYVIVGGVIMTAMMVAIWVARGGMH